MKHGRVAARKQNIINIDEEIKDKQGDVNLRGKETNRE
jgi:hypothetical protein